MTLLVGSVTMVPFLVVFGLLPELWLSWLNPDAEVVGLTAQYLTITALAWQPVLRFLTFSLTLIFSACEDV